MPDAEFKALQEELKLFNLGTLKGLNDWLISRGAIKIDKFGDVIVAIGPTRCLYQELMTTLERAALNKKIEGAGAFGIKHVRPKQFTPIQRKEEAPKQVVSEEKQRDTPVKEEQKDPLVHSEQV